MTNFNQPWSGASRGSLNQSLNSANNLPYVRAMFGTENSTARPRSILDAPHEMSFNQINTKSLSHSATNGTVIDTAAPYRDNVPLNFQSRSNAVTDH